MSERSEHGQKTYTKVNMLTTIRQPSHNILCGFWLVIPWLYYQVPYYHIILLYKQAQYMLNLWVYGCEMLKYLTHFPPDKSPNKTFIKDQNMVKTDIYVNISTTIKQPSQNIFTKLLYSCQIVISW